MSDSCKLGSVQSVWPFLTALEPGQPLARGHRFTDTEITWNHMGLANALTQKTLQCLPCFGTSKLGYKKGNQAPPPPV